MTASIRDVTEVNQYISNTQGCEKLTWRVEMERPRRSFSPCHPNKHTTQFTVHTQTLCLFDITSRINDLAKVSRYGDDTYIQLVYMVSELEPENEARRKEQ